MAVAAVKGTTYSFVLLVKVVDVAVQDLDKELNGGGRLHARVGDTESALETLENAFSVAVELEPLD